MKAIQTKQVNNFKKTAILLALSTAISMPVMAFEAADKVAEEAKVERMTITATRSALNIDDALTSQIVITRQDIDLLNPLSITDLLSSLPSIDISNNGGKGQSASIFMRGTNSDHTLVLVDGVRVSSATLGSTSLNTISPEMIERIEVVQGPRAALWGSDAIGGVIQIFTRQLEGGEHFVGASIGTDEYRKYKAGIGISHGEGQTTVSVSHERADGYDVKDDGVTDNDGYKFTSIAIRGQQKVSQDFVLDWLFSNDQGESEYDSSYNNPDQLENLTDTNSHAWLVRANYQSEISDVKNTTVFSVGQNRDSSDTIFGTESQGLYETRRDQVSLVNNSQFTNNFQMNVGFDYYQDDVSKSTQTYEDEKRDVTGTFLHALYSGEVVSFEGTARHDNVSGVDSENTFNLGTGFKISEDSRFVINYGTGFKVPTFNNLYFPGSDNPDLTSELSETTEIFFETSFSHVNASINIYYSNIEDLIVWNATKSENIDSVKIKGAELSMDYTSSGGKHEANFSYTDAEDLSTNEQLVRRAKEKFNYKFTTSINVADIFAEYKFVGSRSDRYGVDLDAYQLVNIGLNAPLSKSIVLNARASNLLDKEYQTANGYFTQGRALYIGVTYQNF